MTEHPREQPLHEGPVGDSGWLYRTGPIPGFIEFFGPAGQSATIQALEEPIAAIEPLPGEEESGVLVIGEEIRRPVQRSEDEQWICGGTDAHG